MHCLGENSVHKIVKSLLMHAMPPLVSSCTFVEIHPGIELYSILCPKPMLVFSLGIYEMLKKCLIEILGDSTKISSEICKSIKQNESCKQIEKQVLNQPLIFLQDTVRASHGFGLRSNFSKGANHLYTTGIFGVNGLIEISKHAILKLLTEYYHFLERSLIKSVETSATPMWKKYLRAT